MDLKNDEKKQQEKALKRAAGKPHLLVYADRLLLKSGTIAEGLITLKYDLGKLQYELARFSYENELQELIDFFTVALKRHRRMELEKKAEIIAFKDRPKKGGD